MTKKIAILATDGFEDSELVEPFERLRDIGYKVLIVGTAEGKEVEGKTGAFKIVIDVSVDSVQVDDFDALIIPGGDSPAHLIRNEKAVEFARNFQLSLKPTAAICHGPQVLISAETLSGKNLAAGSAIVTEVEAAGGNYVDEAVVIDGNLITSRSPADLPQFIDAVIASLEGEEEQLTA
ncbi:MAG: type 1 glutamine amidotransferase [Actinomycetia bacterium]|nr:type 1 glutamine amidotransferase [Actinomycetes bacterium]